MHFAWEPCQQMLLSNLSIFYLGINFHVYCKKQKMSIMYKPHPEFKQSPASNQVTRHPPWMVHWLFTSRKLYFHWTTLIKLSLFKDLWYRTSTYHSSCFLVFWQGPPLSSALRLSPLPDGPAASSDVMVQEDFCLFCARCSPEDENIFHMVKKKTNFSQKIEYISIN